MTPTVLEAETESFETTHLFAVYGTVSGSETTASNNSMILNNKFERIWKETTLALFKFLCQHLTGQTEECHEESWL